MESDDALVRALEGGDAAAWDALLPRLGPPLLRYLADLTGDARLAEELARDAVLRVHAARAGGDASPLAPAAQLAVAATQLWRERQPEGAGEARARAALWLVAGFGLGEREIGTALGVAPAAAAEWVARARRDPAAGEALRALPLPALPVSLARGV